MWQNRVMQGGTAHVHSLGSVIVYHMTKPEGTVVKLFGIVAVNSLLTEMTMSIEKKLSNGFCFISY